MATSRVRSGSAFPSLQDGLQAFVDVLQVDHIDGGLDIGFHLLFLDHAPDHRPHQDLADLDGVRVQGGGHLPLPDGFEGVPVAVGPDGEDRPGLPGRKDGVHRAQGHFIVLPPDGVDVREAREKVRGDLPRLVPRPFAAGPVDDLEPDAPERRDDPVLHLQGGRVREPFDKGHPAPVPQDAGDVLGDEDPGLAVIESDTADDPGPVPHGRAVEQEHRDSRLVEFGDPAFEVHPGHRRDAYGVDPLVDERLRDPGVFRVAGVLVEDGDRELDVPDVFDDLPDAPEDVGVERADRDGRPADGDAHGALRHGQGGADAVLPLFLGQVKGLVRALDEPRPDPRVLGVGGDAGADRDPRPGAAAGEIVTGDLLPDALEQRDGLAPAGVGEDHDVLVAAVPRGDIVGPLVPVDDGRDLGQDEVPLRVAQGVVVLFEMVDIDHGERRGVLEPLRLLELPAHRIPEVPVVVQAGQAVDGGEVGQRPGPFFQGGPGHERDGHAAGGQERLPLSFGEAREDLIVEDDDARVPPLPAGGHDHGPESLSGEGRELGLPAKVLDDDGAAPFHEGGPGRPVGGERLPGCAPGPSCP